MIPVFSFIYLFIYFHLYFMGFNKKNQQIKHVDITSRGKKVCVIGRKWDVGTTLSRRKICSGHVKRNSRDSKAPCVTCVMCVTQTQNFIILCFLYIRGPDQSLYRRFWPHFTFLSFDCCFSFLWIILDKDICRWENTLTSFLNYKTTPSKVFFLLLLFFRGKNIKRSRYAWNV